MYSELEKKFMLECARKTIESALLKTKERMPEPPECVKEIASCFVTLHSASGDLRGCIGNIAPFEPLINNIVNNAYNAAFKDPRFVPLANKEELDKIEIEISVLTPPEEIPSIDDFELGKHGIIMIKGNHSAVFLPQVAPEQGWDLETTMEHLSAKAGLAPDAWQDEDVRLSTFEAIVFSEKDFR